MKRVDPSRKKWLLRHAAEHDARRQEQRRKQRLRRTGGIGAKRTAKGKKFNHLIAPTDLSLSRNYDNVMRLIWNIRRRALGKSSGHVYVDMTGIRYISPAATLLLVAELDRWRRIKKIKLRPRDLKHIDPQVAYRLAEMGFFKTLAAMDHPRLEPFEDGVRVTEFCTGMKSDLEAASQLSAELQEIAGRSLGEDELLLNDAIAEAMTNSVQHAYPDDEDKDLPWLPGAWWATGSYDANRRLLKVLVYDQGVGIPATLPQSPWWSRIVARVGTVIDQEKVPAGAFRDFRDDAVLIEAAIQEGRTATHKEGRGLGLAEILALVESRAGSHLRIVSRHGEIMCEAGQEIRGQLHKSSLGGTLVEISLTLP